VTDADVLILGGGLAGLACRAALPPHRAATVLEAAEETGGLLRVHQRGGYAFDSVPHVVFFRSRRLLEELRALLPEGLHAFRRTNSIWQDGRRIPYPYQFNALALPEATRAECLDGFRLNPHAGQGGDGEATFRDWLLGQFGPGFYRHFFRPYNDKLYGVPLDALEAAPLRWTIPSENGRAVLAGEGDPAGAPELFYPAGREGIALIPRALERIGRGDVLTGAAAVRVDAGRRTVATADGREFRYRSLVSTIPLPELLKMVGGVPDEVRELGGALAAVPITVVQVGARVTGSALPDIWTYFPGDDVPFYRMTRLERISADLAPAGGAALLLECAGTTAPDRESVLAWLDAHGVVPRSAVEHYDAWPVPYAYVLFLRGYRGVLARIRRALAERGIVTAGRYGGWMYADIEMAMKSGLMAARRLDPSSGRTEAGGILSA
jgi:protoporphyrinogen oxidase